MGKFIFRVQKAEFRNGFNSTAVAAHFSPSFFSKGWIARFRGWGRLLGDCRGGSAGLTIACLERGLSLRKFTIKERFIKLGLGLAKILEIFLLDLVER